MLSVTYNNTTTCKIDGWLRNTIDKPKSADKDGATDKSEMTHLKNDSIKHDSRRIKLNKGNDI